jgi:hypothetical protein
MTTLSSFVDPESGLLMTIPYQVVDPADLAGEATATADRPWNCVPPRVIAASRR